MRAPSQRRALGALFLLLTSLFVAIAVAAAWASAGLRGWVVALAAAAIGLWMASLALATLRRR